MEKFLKDLAEIVKDLWCGFVWLIEVTDALGEILANKLIKIKKKRIKKNTKNFKVKKATKEVIKNCVWDC